MLCKTPWGITVSIKNVWYSEESLIKGTNPQPQPFLKPNAVFLSQGVWEFLLHLPWFLKILPHWKSCHNFFSNLIFYICLITLVLVINKAWLRKKKLSIPLSWLGSKLKLIFLKNEKWSIGISVISANTTSLRVVAPLYMLSSHLLSLHLCSQFSKNEASCRIFHFSVVFLFLEQRRSLFYRQRIFHKHFPAHILGYKMMNNLKWKSRYNLLSI